MGTRDPRVHYNAESLRPFAPGAVDRFSLTTFRPLRGIGGHHVLDATIDDSNDLRSDLSSLYNVGEYPPRNRSWNMRSLHPHLPK